jgi:bifunctional non-homologous end joining protein LigD
MTDPDPDALEEYRSKRHFGRTAEPTGTEKSEEGRADEPEPLARQTAAASVAEAGDATGSAPRRVFVVQKHDASRLHYDFRLEMGGVLKSWAVPKGPSLDPADKRLAVMVEDHPLEYADFEGSIPQGEYGGGTVMVWDSGWWEPDIAPEDALAKGELKFVIHGEKLKGSWALVKTKWQGENNWLLIKHRDEAARPGSNIEAEAPDSVATGRSLEQIAADAR